MWKLERFVSKSLMTLSRTFQPNKMHEYTNQMCFENIQNILHLQYDN